MVASMEVRESLARWLPLPSSIQFNSPDTPYPDIIRIIDVTGDLEHEPVARTLAANGLYTAHGTILSACGVVL